MKKTAFLAAVLAAAVPVSPQEKNPEIFFSLAGSAPVPPLSPVNSVYLNRTELEGKKINGLGDILEEIPSAVVRRSGGGLSASFASLRGFYAKQTCVLVDGVKVPKDLTGTVDLSLLPADNLSSVEILKGGWSALYGSDAEGGVVSLVTRRLNRYSQTAEASAEYSSFGTRAYELKSGFRKKDFEFFAGARNYYTAGFQKNSGAKKNSFNGRFSYDSGDYGRITAGGFAVKAERGLPGGTPAELSSWDGKKERSANTPWDSQKDDNYMANLSYELEAGENGFSAGYGRGVYSVFARQYNSWTASFDETAIKTISNSFSLRSTFGGYRAGAEAELNDLRSNVYGSHGVKKYGYFVNKTYPLGGKVSVMPMLRFDDNSAYPSVWSPKVLAVYSFSDELRFSVQAGRSWQAPAFADLYNPWAPNPALRPEKSLQGEFSAEYASASGFHSSAGLYYYDIKDRIALDPGRSWAAYNMDEAFNSGLEAEAGFTGGPLRFSAGLNAMNCRGRTTGEGSYKKLAYSPSYKFNSSLKYKSGAVEAAFKMEGISAQYSGRDRTGKKIPAYRVYGLLVSVRRGPFEFYGGVENLFDERYAVSADSFNGYYPADPRTFRGGVKGRF